MRNNFEIFLLTKTKLYTSFQKSKFYMSFYSIPYRLGINVYSGSFLYYESHYSRNKFITITLWLQKRIHHESVVTVISSIPVRLYLDDFYSSSALKPQTLFAKSV